MSLRCAPTPDQLATARLHGAKRSARVASFLDG
jgi:hypothetical protein